MYSSYIFVCWIFHLTYALCIFRIINFIILQKKKKKDIKIDRHKRQTKQYLIFSFNERIYNFQYIHNINKWLMVEYLIYYKSTIKIIHNNNYCNYQISYLDKRKYYSCIIVHCSNYWLVLLTMPQIRFPSLLPLCMSRTPDY